MDRHGTIRSSAGSSVAAPLSGFRQPPSAEPSVAGAALPVHLSLLSRFGGHQQCRRTGLAPTGNGPLIVHLIFKCLKTLLFDFWKLSDTDDLSVRVPQ